MDLSFIKQELSNKGYCVVSNVLNETEINRCKHSFQSWLNESMNNKNCKTKIISNTNHKSFCQNLNFFKKFLKEKDF